MDGVRRRRFLRGLAVGAGTATLAGCARFVGESADAETTAGPDVSSPDPVRGTARGSGRSDPVPGRESYGEVVDVVAAGADSSGREPIDPVLDRVLADDTLVVFPPGRYRVDETVDVPAFANLGLLGREATLVPGPDLEGVLFTLGRPGRARDLRLAGFELDFAGREAVPRPFICRVDDGLLVRDVAVRGASRAARVDVADPSGVGLVERVLLPGAPPDVYAVGFLVTDHTRGALTVRDCRIAGYPNNGLYASPSRGPVRVIGGTFADNGIANVRVSGDSVVRGARVACDVPDERFRNARGIWVRHGRDALVEDCAVRLRRVHSSDGAITVGGAGRIRNVDVRVDADGIPGLSVRGHPGGGSRGDGATADGDGATADGDGATVDGDGATVDGDGATADGDAVPTTDGAAIPDADRETAGDPGDLAVANLRVTGTAAGASAVRITDRSGCSFDSLSIRQTGADRDGLTAIRAGEVSVRGDAVAVTGSPFRARRSTIAATDVRTKRLSTDAAPTE